MSNSQQPSRAAYAMRVLALAGALATASAKGVRAFTMNVPHIIGKAVPNHRSGHSGTYNNGPVWLRRKAKRRRGGKWVTRAQ